MRGKKKTKSELVQEVAALRKRLTAFEKADPVKTPRSSPAPREPRFIDLEKRLEGLKPNEHLCLIYESPEEWHAAIIPFLTIGLRRGEKCIYIVSTHTAKDIRTYLSRAGLDVENAEASGQLLILHKTEATTQEGFFDPEQMIALLIAESEKALAEGYPNLRLTEEAGVQVQGYLGLERLLEYEAKLNRDFFSRYPCTAICQYDRWKSNPAMIKNAIMTHPLIVRNNQVHQNFYYISPEEFLMQKREEREVQDWLSSIEQESEAEKRVRFLSDVLERSSQPFTVSYPDGYIMFCNPAFSALTGYTEEELHAMTWGLHLTPPKWRAPEEEVFEKLNRTREPQRYEKEILRKDGTQVAAEVLVHLISRPRGEIQYYYTFVTDISDRKRAEEMLSQSQARLKSLFEDSPISLWEEDFSEVKRYIDMLKESGSKDIGAHFDNYPEAVVKCASMVRVLDVNKASLELFGARKKRQLVEAGLSETFTEDSYEAFKQELIAIAEGQGSCETVVYAQTLTGEEKILNMKWLVAPGHEQTLSRLLVSIVDITDLKRAERVLRESEEKFRKLAEQMPNMVYINKEGRVVYANQRCEEITGYTREEFCSPDFDFLDLIAPESLDIVKSSFGRHMRGEQVQPYEYTIVTADGKRVDSLGTTTLIEYEGESAVLGVITDITERKRAEERLKRSEAMWRSLVEHAPNIITTVDRDGTIRFVNRTVTGVSVDKVIGTSIYDYIGRAYHDVVKKSIEKVFKTGKEASYESQAVGPSGSISWYDCRIGPVIQDGRVAAVTLIAADVTEHKGAEEALRESEARMRLYLHSAEDVIVAQDAKGRYIYYNGPARYGMTREDVVGKTPHDLHDRKTARSIMEDLKQVVRSKKGLSRENKVVWMGETLWFTDRLSPIIRGGDVNGVLTISRNITEHKKAEMAVEEAKVKYESLAETLGELIYRADPKTLEPTYVNTAIRKFYGYSKKQWLAHPELWESLIHEQDRRRVMKEFMEARKKGKERAIEYRIRRRDGTVRWVEDHIVWERDARGRIVSMNGVMYDITARKRMERDISRRERIARERALMLSELRDLIQIDDILARTCEAIRDSGLFERGVMTLHEPGGVITHLGQVGLDEKVIARARKAPPMDSKTRRRITSERFRISDSFFIPVEAGVDLKGVERHIRQPKKTTDGDWQTGDELFVPLRDASGGVTGYLSVDTPTEGHRPDVETVSALEMLVEAAASRIREVRVEEAYRAVVDNSLQGILILQGSGIVFANAVVARMLDIPLEKVSSLSMEKMDAFIHPADRESTWKLHSDRLAGRPTPTNYEFRMVRRDGSTRWIEVFTSAITYRGKPATQSSLIDITERKQLEQRVLESTEFTEKVLNTVVDSIFVTDLERKFVICNDATERIFGYRRKEMIGKSVEMLYPDRQSFEKAARTDLRMLREQGHREGEVTLKRKDGSILQTRDTASLLTDADGKPIGVVAVIRDIQ